jgi:RimJ/RimL family protein N-acetyltransferase
MQDWLMPTDISGPVATPVIETERLLLRPHRVDDFEACAAMWADPAVTRFIGGKPFSAEESWARLLRYAGHWTLMGFGFWAIEEKATGKFIGEAGFAEFKRDIEPSLGGAPEMGWVLASQVHGRGYATEAVRAAIAWSEAHLASSKVVCLIHPDHAASIHVAVKCGFRESRRASYKNQPILVFERDTL